MALLLSKWSVVLSDGGTFSRDNKELYLHLGRRLSCISLKSKCTHNNDYKGNTMYLTIAKRCIINVSYDIYSVECVADLLSSLLLL